MDARFYSTPEWAEARELALARDGDRCTVARLLGGPCAHGPLHAHHIVRPEDGGDPLDVDNLGTTCARHHPMWARLRRALDEVRDRDLQADLSRRARLLGFVRATGHVYLERDMREQLVRMGAEGRELEGLLALAAELRARAEDQESVAA